VRLDAEQAWLDAPGAERGGGDDPEEDEGSAEEPPPAPDKCALRTQSPRLRNPDDRVARLAIVHTDQT
jgi:hypothetical protein